MTKLIEVIDSLNNENAEEVKKQLTDEANVLSKANSDLYKRAKKAEGFEYNRDAKEWIKKEVKPVTPSETKPTEAKIEEAKSNEPDYALDAFLEGRDVKNPDDKKMVTDEMERLKLSAGDILGMEHIKSKLKDSKNQRTAEAGMPKGSGSGKGKSKGDVDYYLAKEQGTEGSTPDDLELAEKVISARMKKQENSNKFSEEMYTG